VQSLYNTAGGSVVCSDAFPFALTRLFFQALKQPIKIHVGGPVWVDATAIPFPMGLDLWHEFIEME
jgi:hypothetical protein